MNKKYWSQRKGINAKFDLDGLKRSFKSIATHFSDSGYFQEYYGFYCVDQGYTYGKAGIDIDEFIFRRTRREVKWPIHENLQSLNLDTFFDMIEFLHDTISKPLNGSYHSYAGCGYHYSTFDTATGQAEYRNEFNQILRDFEDGYELNSSGEIQFMLTSGLKELTEASVPATQEESKLINQRVERAISKYRNRHSDSTDRREVVREFTSNFSSKECFTFDIKYNSVILKFIIFGLPEGTFYSLLFISAETSNYELYSSNFVSYFDNGKSIFTIPMELNKRFNEFDNGSFYQFLDTENLEGLLVKHKEAEKYLQKKLNINKTRLTKGKIEAHYADAMMREIKKLGIFPFFIIAVCFFKKNVRTNNIYDSVD
ncbi:hypothetical protein FH587_02175 (plasmid) [Leptospira interrogans]|uniref:hypothetical protein n=1 Tax=Leptospira interrogans TaxID=173 RepID=UPI001F0828C8|nr:hypothetical protein [Leptospira interrogans]UML82790.1 hypothetical protein FH587_02175 [Leptospira interrogans]